MATLLLYAGTAGAATYYVDYNSGVDSNSGTSTTSPWKRHPYMVGFSGSYSHAAGDRFIFKGGVSWPNSCFQMNIRAGGSSGAPDYYGASTTWYAGSSFTRPRFDFSGTASSTPRVNLASISYITFDNLEFSGLAMSDGGAWPHISCVLFEGGSYGTVQNCYAHGWSSANGKDGSPMFFWHSHANGTAVNNVIDGTESIVSGNSVGMGIVGATTICSNYIRNIPNAIMTMDGVQNVEVASNVVDTVPGSIDASEHENGIYVLSGGRIHHNYVHDVVAGAQTIYIETAWNNVANTTYVYDNVVYRPGSGCIVLEYENTSSQLNTVTYIYNNTLIGGSNPCIRAVPRTYMPKTVYNINNHCVSDVTTFAYNNSGNGSIGTVTAQNNLVQTTSAATSAGYSVGNLFRPSSSSAPTVGAGADLSSTFNTDYLGKTRTAPWDIGAHDYSSDSSTTQVSPPAVSSVTQVGGDVDSTVSGIQAYAGSSVQYTGSASDPNGLALSWKWVYTVNGGAETVQSSGTGTVAPLTFAYPTTSAGSTYVWKLRVSNSSATSESSLTVGVEAVPQSAPPTVSSITQVGGDVDAAVSGIQAYAGSSVQYTGSASGSTGSALSWKWVYTVNGGAETVQSSGTGTVAPLTFTYPTTAAGSTYVWKLRVSNSSATSESSVTVGIEAVPQNASYGSTVQASSGTIASPFVVSSGAISQTVQTTVVTDGGRAAYNFSVPAAGTYIVVAQVNAPDDSANSMFVNIDAEPQSPTMIWDIPVTSGTQSRIVSWRGTGTDTNNQFAPKTFSLAAGSHQLIIRGREPNVQLSSFLIARPPSVSAITQGGTAVTTAATTSSSTLQVSTGSAAQYSATASSPDGRSVTWQWIYCVNGGAETVASSGSGTVAPVSYTYPSTAAGSTYTWKLRANDGVSSAESSLQISVSAGSTPQNVNTNITVSTMGAYTAPFVITNGYLVQPTQITVPANAGRFSCSFSVATSGNYVVKAMINAPSDAENSLFVNIDAEPTDPLTIWDVPVTTGFTTQTVAWRGNGTPTASQYSPKTFTLSAGTHQLIVRGREANTQIKSFSIVPVPASPTNLRVVAQ